MSKKINCAQAYKVFHHFLDTIYFETYDDELGGFLGSAALYSATPGKCPQTMDAAIWYDWMNAVKIIVGDDSITYDFYVTIDQAYTTMHQYFVRYCEIGSGPSFEKIRDLTNKSIKQSQLTQWFSVRWMQSVDHVLQEDPFRKIGHFFTGESPLTHFASFAIMQTFLDTLCQRNDDPDLIQLVQNSRLENRDAYWLAIPDIIESKTWQIWQQAIGNALLQNHSQELNLLIAYKTMPLFLVNYFDNNQSEFIDMIITKFEVQDDTMPQLSFFWRSWASATVKLNGERIAIVNNLVSINKLVSQGTAYKIIQAWFAEYKNLLEADFIETIFSSTSEVQSIWQQAVASVKQKPRSYLLLDDEVTILETYHIMLKLLELCDKNVPEFAVDNTNKPTDFNIMLQWIRICEQVENEKN